MHLNFNSFSLQLQQSQLSQLNEYFAHYFFPREKSKALILSFLDRCHYSAGYKFLSLTYKAIARACSLSIKTIERRLPELIADGWVIVSISKNGLINRYKLNVDKIRNTIGQLAVSRGVSHPPTVEGNPRQLTGDLNTLTEKKINKKPKEKVFENQFSFKKKRVTPKPILKTEKQKQKKDLVVGQQDQKLDNGHHTNLLNKNIHFAPEKIEGEKSYDHIQLDDEGWCIDTQTENLNQQPEPEPIHIPTENDLVVRENDRQEYLQRAENCGVKFDAWLKRYCLTVALNKLDKAINCLEQQTSNKNQARAKAHGRGETDINTNPRYRIQNPTNFLISALDNEWEPNTKSESYLTNGSSRQFTPEDLRSQMTPADIKAKYKPDKWREAAEHFGYTYEEVANAILYDDSGGMKSLIQKIKDIAQKFNF